MDDPHQAATAPATSTSTAPRDAWSLSRPRLLLSLALGVLATALVFSGPPLDRVVGVDLRFGLEGPLAGDPWKWLGAGLVVAVVLGVERLGPASLLVRPLTRRDAEWVLYAFGTVMAWSWVVGRLAPRTATRASPPSPGWASPAPSC